MLSGESLEIVIFFPGGGGVHLAAITELCYRVSIMLACRLAMSTAKWHEGFVQINNIIQCWQLLRMGPLSCWV